VAWRRKRLGFFLNVRDLPDGLRRSACIFFRTACAQYRQIGTLMKLHLLVIGK
jgi:hypothetical protein